MSGERLEQALGAYRKRYRRGGRQERSKVLDEFCALTNYHRKYAIALLGRAVDNGKLPAGRRRGPTIRRRRSGCWRLFGKRRITPGRFG